MQSVGGDGGGDDGEGGRWQGIQHDTVDKVWAKGRRSGVSATYLAL